VKSLCPDFIWSENQEIYKRYKRYKEKLNEEDKTKLGKHFGAVTGRLSSVTTKLASMFSKSNVRPRFISFFLSQTVLLQESASALEVVLPVIDYSELPNTEVNFLAWVFLLNGNLESAKAIFDKADLSPIEMISPNEEFINNLMESGILLQKQEEYAAAQDEFERLIRISTFLLGEGHESTIICATNLIQTLSNQKRYREAEAASRKWLEISKASLKNEHMRTIFLGSWLGYTLCLQERYEDAEGVFRQWLDVSRKIFGEEYWLTIDLSSTIGWALNGQKRYSEAEKRLDSCYKTSNSEYVKTTSAWWLGESLFWQGKYDLAEEYLLYSFHHSSDIPIVAEPIQPRVIHLLVDLYNAWGKPEEAKKYRDMLPESETSNGAEEQ
jgi:tetratricopeptide (TPR) repeat protein